MFRYIIKRILIFIPTLFAISLVIYMLSVFAPGDPIVNMLSQQQGDGNQSDKIAGEEEYEKMRRKFNFHLPTFYFNLATQADSDTLHKIKKKGEQELLARLTSEYGDWDNVSNYYHTIKKYENNLYAFAPDSVSKVPISKVKSSIIKLYLDHDDKKIRNQFNKVDGYLSNTNDSLGLFTDDFTGVKEAYTKMVENPNNISKYLPAIHWHGTNNRYHKWITRFMVFDFGISYKDQLLISDKIGERIYWTMLLSILSIILTYLLAIPLGVFSAVNKGNAMDNVSSTILFMLYSLPNFWVATLLINYLCNPEYLQLFPAFGVGDIAEGQSFVETFFIRLHHLILPLFCWTYASLAFLSRQMRGGMLGVLRQDYIRTARAKGLSEKTVIWKHAFKNSLLPIITLFANVFPRMIAGSVVLEVIFSLPGMGKMLVDAMASQNFPVVFTIVMMVAVLTMIGYLIADVLYAFVDPRITYSSKG
ncbi:MAG: peptide/nickel transport system permease protein [Maribacter sp.]|jgi:peptide/nickel transport system permease protein